MESLWEVTQVLGEPQPCNLTGGNSCSPPPGASAQRERERERESHRSGPAFFLLCVFSMGSLPLFSCFLVRAVTVFAAVIQPKLASTLIRKLNTCAPLTSLSHVKRVRKLSLEDGVELSIILCLAPFGNCEWPSSKAPPEVFEVVEEHKLNPFVATVSQCEACSRDEWEEQCRLWPTSYHPNAVKLHQVVSFEENQVREICKFMRAAMGQAKLAAKSGQPPNGAVIVDPAAGLIVSAGYDETGRWKNGLEVEEINPQQVKGCGFTKNEDKTQLSEQKNHPWHPLRHALMVAIERAAEKNLSMKGENKLSEADSSRANSKRLRTSETIENMERPSSGGEQYLCTGLDAYVTREPCSMCAMALLHQRVHRVFYGVANTQVGAVGGVRRLHGQQGLNHHYLVFQVALCEEDILMHHSTR